MSCVRFLGQPFLFFSSYLDKRDVFYELKQNDTKKQLIFVCFGFVSNIAIFNHFSVIIYRYPNSCDVIIRHLTNAMECPGHLFLYICHIWYRCRSVMERRLKREMLP